MTGKHSDRFSVDMCHEVPQAVQMSAPKLSEVIKPHFLPLLCKNPGQFKHRGIVYDQYALVLNPTYLAPEDSELTLRKWSGGPPPGKKTDLDVSKYGEDVIVDWRTFCEWSVRLTAYEIQEGESYLDSMEDEFSYDELIV